MIKIMKIRKEQVKCLCMILFGANISSIILGILHYIIGLNIIIGTIFSIIIVLTWFLNSILIILNDFKIILGMDLLVFKLLLFFF